MATHLQIINFYMRSSIYILYSLISLIKFFHNFFYVPISFSSMLHFLMSDEWWKFSSLCYTLNSFSHFCGFYYFFFFFLIVFYTLILLLPYQNQLLYGVGPNMPILLPLSQLLPLSLVTTIIVIKPDLDHLV